MGLGVDFNPTAPRVKAPTKTRAPKPKAVVVKESRFTAAEAKPRAGAPRAFAEEAATSKRILAVANRKPPQVHWIIPGLDVDDGRAHPPPSGGGRSLVDVDEAMDAARDKAQASYDRHVIESDYIRNTAAPNNVKGTLHQEHEEARRADMWARDAAKTREAAQRTSQDLNGEVVRGAPSHAGAVRRRGVAYVKPTEPPRLGMATRSTVLPSYAPETQRIGARTRLGATPMRGLRRDSEASPASPASDSPPRRLALNPGTLEDAEAGQLPSTSRTRRSAAAINWRVEPHLRVPEARADAESLRGELNEHLAEAEEELRHMKRDSRLKTQTSEKVEYLKTQIERMAGKVVGSQVEVDLTKLGLSSVEADRARKLGFWVDGKNLRQHGQYRNAAFLRRALDESESSAAGSGADADDSRTKNMESITGFPHGDAAALARNGYQARKSANNSVLFYDENGKQVARTKVISFLKSYTTK